MKDISAKLAAFTAGAFILALCLEMFLRGVGSLYVTAVPATERKAGGAYTVLCIGDSFTNGAGAPPESSYPRQLETVLKARAGARAP